MGRDLKRVALDFDWPLGKRWGGFLHPHYVKCPECDGHGATLAKRRLEDIVGLILLSGEDAVRRQSHPYFQGWEFHAGSGVCGPEMTDLSTGLAGRSPLGRLGHDAIDRWTAAKKVIAAAGLDPETWGWCPTCKGNGIHPDHAAAYEAWKPTEPPAGEGWQVWENVTEGSPISPVFATEGELVAWLVTEGYSESAAREFCKRGFAFSMVMTGGKISHDIEMWDGEANEEDED